MEEYDLNAHRVAVISDTHGLLRPEIARVLETCELILHAGDIDTSQMLEKLREVAKTYAVRGNADGDLDEELPKELLLTLWGFQIYMIHNRKQIRENLEGVDFVVYGHSHKYEVRNSEGITYLNPGGCGRRRFHLPVTMLVLTLYPKEHRFEIEKIDASPVISQGEELSQLSGKDMHRLIRDITKAVDAGQKVSDIAAKKRVDVQLAEQICRIYVTHPGVDVDGILNRMEIKNL